MFKIPQIDINTFKEQNIHFGIFNNDVTMSVFSETKHTLIKKVLKVWDTDFSHLQDVYHLGVLREDGTEHHLYHIHCTTFLQVTKISHLVNSNFKDISAQ